MLVIRSPRILIALVALFTAGIFLARPAIAHAAGVDEESQFILNTFAFLLWGALVMWMCAGFTMLESGSVRTKNASTICLKNIGIYSIAGLAFFFIGYNLMYTDVGEVGLWGKFEFLYGPSADEIALINGEDCCRDCYERCAKFGQQVIGNELLRDVGLVLPDGVRGDGCVNSIGSYS